MKVTIADSLFMQYCKSAKLGPNNHNVSPTHFEWELADPDTARFVTDPLLKHAKGPGQVALLLESFFLHPEDYLTALQKPFDYVLTHNSYFAQNQNWLWYPGCGSWVAFDNWKLHPKTKQISILQSPKKTMPGHRMAHEVIQKFGDKMGVFGVNEYADKMDAIAPYRYSLIIEAERAPGWFSEKLIDCFALGTIPIYWGCPDVGRYFDSNGIYPVESMEDIAIFLDHIAYHDFYHYSKQKEISFNFERAKTFRILEDWIFMKYPFLFEEK